MGKVSYTYTESEDTEDTGCSADNLKNKTKKKFSMFKSKSSNVKKMKYKVRSLSEPQSEYGSGKLRGILKHTRDRDSSDDDDDDDLDGLQQMPRDKCLVGRVPRPPGSGPGRGGGVAIIIRKNTDMAPLQSLQYQPSTSSAKRRRFKNLMKKRSYT